jgi:hypothetical protein
MAPDAGSEVWASLVTEPLRSITRLDIFPAESESKLQTVALSTSFAIGQHS